MRADARDVARADQAEEGVARGAVAVFFRALEPFGMNADDGDAGFRRNPFADGADVIPDQADDAGGIDKRRLGGMMGDEFEQPGFEFLLAAEDHVHFLKIGGETLAMELGAAREGAANVPGVGGAANRPVDNVQRVGDGIQNHARATKHTGALADRTGDTGLVAGHLGGPAAALFHDRGYAGGEHFDHTHTATFAFAPTSLPTSRPSMRSSAHSFITEAPMLR